MSNATIINEKFINDFLNEITRALLLSDVQFKLVRDMQTNVMKIVNLDDLKRIRNVARVGIEVFNQSFWLIRLEKVMLEKKGAFRSRVSGGDASGCSYQLLDSAPSSRTIQLGHIQPQAPGHSLSQHVRPPALRKVVRIVGSGSTATTTADNVIVGAMLDKRPNFPSPEDSSNIRNQNAIIRIPDLEDIRIGITSDKSSFGLIQSKLIVFPMTSRTSLALLISSSS
ncbi:hypothetical protein L6452_44288 [Arctium lappa]|uniref:Uncharacterized protein n=1 Tax=Arctium lappa TaxID=4217 RepID=A0ACB8XFS9_ARCLA|nr:hypothetical protein L6452_44288 [Arctium lappa]